MQRDESSNNNSADPAAARESATSLADELLMQRVAAGDVAALTALFDRHAGLIFSICLRVLHDRGEAEQQLIDVFFELWEKRDRYDASRSSPRTFLVMLARSRAIDRRRKMIASGALKNVELSINEHEASSLPIDQASDDEEAVAIAGAVAQLDPEQRKVIQLAFYDGLTHTEIAKKLGKPLGTVKTYIRQGLIRLRSLVRMNQRGNL